MLWKTSEGRMSQDHLEGELVKTARRSMNYPAQLQVQPLRQAGGRASLPEQA